MQIQTNVRNSQICRTFKLGRRCRRTENVAFIIAHCTNESSQLIPLRFLETILSHVEILFGAICHGKQDRIYYLLHSIIAGPGVLPRWERSQKYILWRKCTSLHLSCSSSAHVDKPIRKCNHFCCCFVPIFIIV